MPDAAQKLNILFLCTGNSCRSQMAEGWGRHLKGDLVDFHSAGIETHGLNPNAVKGSRTFTVAVRTCSTGCVQSL